jgi:hypothetical protein
VVVLKKNYLMNPGNFATRQSKMFSLIESWKTSGQSQHIFCKEHAIVYSNFHYWYKKYREQQQGTPGEAFLPVKIKKSVGSSSEHGVMELLLANGHRLIFYQLVDVSYLRSLVG